MKSTEPALEKRPTDHRIEAERLFLRRAYMMIVVCGFGITLLRLNLLHADIYRSTFALGMLVLAIFGAGAFWLTSTFNPRSVVVAVAVMTLPLLFTIVIIKREEAALFYFCVQILLLCSMSTPIVVFVFTAACTFGTGLLAYSFPELDQDLLGTVVGVVIMTAATGSLFSELRNRAEDARATAEKTTMGATRAALANVFPATTLVEEGHLRDPSIGFVRLFDGGIETGIDDGAPIAHLCDPEEYAALVDAMHTGTPLEIRKGERVVEIFSSPVLSGGQGKECFVMAARDVTERARLARQLATSQRVVALGELAAGVAHEIHNPLTSLMLCVGFLEEGTPPEDEDISEIQRAAERIRQTVNDLTALTNDQGEPVIVTTAAETIESALRLAEATIRAADASITVVHEDGEVWMNAAPTRTSQAFAHLIVNAVNACGDPPQRRPQLKIITRQHGGYVEIRIADNGFGVDPSILPRIFDPFVSTREVGDGSGLGLSLAHNVMTAAEGSLEIEKTDPSGTIFLTRLVAAENPGDEERLEETSKITTPPAPTTRVLVASEERSIAEGIGRVLSEYVEVVVVNSGPNALELLSSQVFDLVICDLTMRTVSGIEILATLPKATEGVALTGGTFSPRAQRFLEGWQGDVLAKPVLRRHLIRLIKRFRENG